MATIEVTATNTWSPLATGACVAQIRGRGEVQVYIGISPPPEADEVYMEFSGEVFYPGTETVYVRSISEDVKLTMTTE